MSVDRRAEKLKALGRIEAYLLEQGGDSESLLYLWLKTGRHHEVGETIAMSQKGWVAFGRVSKTKVKLLPNTLANKLDALKLLQ